MKHAVLLFIHFSSAIFWVGGMAFAYFCLRPAAGSVLEPPQRLALWAATFARFFRYVAIAVVLLIGSGLWMILRIGLSYAPHGWLAMMVLGLFMAGVFVFIYWRLYPRLVGHVSAGRWPDAAAALNDIRQLVALNLVLSVLTVAAAAFSR
ncbi:CopD family protein [Nitrogeniibacter aestuarii]|uniref:CopD family protein n=1 Tax=Nitrogeniibacter aestuarii TaxID=2815343 RepID=UPI001E58A8EE|nr:CopD family protein [Nitrogeniibacter aestuarii]